MGMLLRRYYKLKAEAAAERGADPIARAFEAKRAEAPALAPLPAGFPFAERLAAAGYTAADELRGADEAELVGKGFKAREARAIRKALEALG